MLPILIVDDEPHIARLIEMTLEPLGQPLVLACDGEQAADLLEKQQFDLVLLDVMLPGVDGFALMDYIAPTGTPVIFLTAKNAVADRVRGLKLGAYDYIVKPFAPAELLARVEGLLRHTGRRAAGWRAGRSGNGWTRWRNRRFCSTSAMSVGWRMPLPPSTIPGAARAI